MDPKLRILEEWTRKLKDVSHLKQQSRINGLCLEDGNNFLLPFPQLQKSNNNIRLLHKEDGTILTDVKEILGVRIQHFEYKWTNSQIY